MVAVKAHQAQAFLASPDARYAAILFYGTDAGLISERAERAAKLLADRGTPRGEILRIDDADLDGEPDRLAVELRTVPMFGGRKIVRATAGRRVTAAALEPLLAEGELEGLLIVEAGNLKPSDALRALFEKSQRAAAVACYGDEAQDLEVLVREVLKGAGLTITSEARESLLGRLGADRALSRAEVEKLALYAHGKAEIDVADVEAIVGDASELALERIFFAAASGLAGRAVGEMSRAVQSGESPQAVVAATQRHFQRLHRVRVALDQGRGLDEALRHLRPPLHFKQKEAFVQQCRTWTTGRLNEALNHIASAAKVARLSPVLEEAVTERLLLRLAQLAKADADGNRVRT
jgi:DNA polymerase-3 subunit delta